MLGIMIPFFAGTLFIQHEDIDAPRTVRTELSDQAKEAVQPWNAWAYQVVEANRAPDGSVSGLVIYRGLFELEVTRVRVGPDGIVDQRSHYERARTVTIAYVGLELALLVVGIYLAWYRRRPGVIEQSRLKHEAEAQKSARRRQEWVARLRTWSRKSAVVRYALLWSPGRWPRTAGWALWWVWLAFNAVLFPGLVLWVAIVPQFAPIDGTSPPPAIESDMKRLAAMEAEKPWFLSAHISDYRENEAGETVGAVSYRTLLMLEVTRVEIDGDTVTVTERRNIEALGVWLGVAVLGHAAAWLAVHHVRREWSRYSR
jgi:hypothetical protein